MTTRRDHPLRPLRLLGFALGLAAPALAVLLGLAIIGQLSTAVAVAAAAAAWLIALPLAARLLTTLQAVRRWIESLGTEASPPELADVPGFIEIASALVRVRRRTDGAQAKAEERARTAETIFDALPDPVIMIDHACRIVGANAAARAQFGPRLVGLDLGAALRSQKLRETAMRVIGGKGDEAGPGQTVAFDMTGAVERAYQAHVMALGPVLPEGPAAAVAMQDLTAARRIDEMRRDFVANISHELKTPLAGIVGFIETLRGPAAHDAAARRKFLDIMDQQASRMARLIEDLLSLSAIEANEHQRPQEPVDLVPLLRRAAAHLDGLAKARKTQVDVALDKELPETAEVLGAADQLTQVFENLIDNAIKYSPEGGRVLVSLRARQPQGDGAPSEYEAEVRDWGPGIPPEHIPRLTERFYRADAARSRQLGGTGLGLAIVKHILNRHQGTLRIESRVGEGSRFIVRLPAARARD